MSFGDTTIYEVKMTKDELIELLSLDLQREWQHLDFYLKNSSTVTGLHRQEYSEFLLDAAKNELQHVKEFQDLLIGLGAKIPLKYELVIEIDERIDKILHNALKLEEEVLDNYAIRIEQAEKIGGTDGRWIAVFLEGQLQHSREDADNIKQILKGI